jgi:hypothetical protein
VRADSLKPGEHLKTFAGLIQVAAIVPRAGPQDVYNLEVQFAHVYHVATDAVLVHNG